jgi:hypothetical protein
VIAFGDPGRPQHRASRSPDDSTPGRDALQFSYSENRPALGLPGTTRPSLAIASLPGLAADVIFRQNGSYLCGFAIVMAQNCLIVRLID